MAHLVDDSTGMSVLCMPLDSLDIQHPIRLIKVDVEGHELAALRGMRRLLERDRPVLIIKGRSPEVAGFLSGFGYQIGEEEGSPNRVFTRASKGEARTIPSLGRHSCPSLDRHS
jgi:hypothetical protein